jgi:hypothetical protein
MSVVFFFGRFVTEGCYSLVGCYSHVGCYSTEVQWSGGCYVISILSIFLGL